MCLSLGTDSRRCFLMLSVFVIGVVVTEITAQQQRIIGGTTARDGQFPYQVSVQLSSVCTSSGHVCGGALVGSAHAVTAASCVTEKPGGGAWTNVRPTQYRVHVGLADLEDISATFNVLKIIVHPAYSPDTLAHDLAVLQLGEAVDTSGAPAQVARAAPAAGTPCNITGWGIFSAEEVTYRRYLLSEEVVVLNETDCPETPSNNTVEMICAGDADIDTCLGDVGAPLVCGGQLVGLAAAPGCGDGSIFTDLAAHRDWISAAVGGGVVNK